MPMGTHRLQSMEPRSSWVGLVKARGEAGIQVTENPAGVKQKTSRSPRMGKGWAVATQIDASEFGIGGDSALEYALSDRRRACVFSLSGGVTKTTILGPQS